MMKRYDCAVIGGDQRQVYMINELISKGRSVVFYGMSDERINRQACEAGSLSEALTRSDVILCPVPFTRNKTGIATLEDFTDASIDYFLTNLKENHRLFSGNIPPYVTDYCTRQGIRFYDLMQRNDVAVLNAISTAEGAIAEAIKRSDRNLHQSKCMVLGFGRCARILAKKLNAFDVKVCVCARSRDARVLAMAYGYDAISLEELDNQLCTFDYIFNTVPAVILTKNKLERLSGHVTIIDIASAPGGVDYIAAKEAKVNAVLCPGLPGKYAPKTSGEILADVIENILTERSDENETG